MIVKLLLNTRTMCTVFIEVLMNILKIKNQILIVFDDIITNMLSNKNIKPVVTELFISSRKINNFYVDVPRNIRHNSRHFLIIKIRRKQQTPIIYLSDKHFMRLYKKYTAKPYSFLPNNTNFPPDDISCFRRKP